jgi:hypothetical protein
MLRVLEEGTPWKNKARLYIGLIKEAVQTDMKDSCRTIKQGTRKMVDNGSHSFGCI